MGDHDEVLDEYRSSIDNIDAALVHLLAERLSLVGLKAWVQPRLKSTSDMWPTDALFSSVYNRCSALNKTHCLGSRECSTVLNTQIFLKIDPLNIRELQHGGHGTKRLVRV